MNTYTIKLTEDEYAMLCNLAMEGLDSYNDNGDFDTPEEKAEYEAALNKFTTSKPDRKETQA